MKTISKLILTSVLIISIGNLSAKASIRESANMKSEKAIKTLAVAVSVVEKVTKEDNNGIPQALIENSEVMVIFPGECKIAAGAYNARGGKGVALIRDENGSWSHPIFVIIREGSMGHNSVGQASDIVLFFRNRDDIKNIDQVEIILGDDIDIEPGPKNRAYSSNGNSSFNTQIYAYQGSKGKFTGANLKGGILSHYARFSGPVYGLENINPEEILNGKEVLLNPDMTNLMEALTCLVYK